MIEYYVYAFIGFFVLLGFLGLRIVRPIEVGLIETFGKYTRTGKQGLHWIIPIVQVMIKVNMTERMVDVKPQLVITKDKLNAEIDAVVYYQIKEAQKAEYNVDNHKSQLTSLARTTLRAVIGKMTLTDANEKRDEINSRVEEILDKETDSYGVEVLRVEIQRVEPPKDVQEAMNKVVKAEQEKTAAVDIATAAETKADGERRATIKVAEGDKQGKILTAEGEAKAFDLINKSFTGNAQLLEKLKTTVKSLRDNAKIVVPAESELVNVIGDLSGVLPFKKK